VRAVSCLAREMRSCRPPMLDDGLGITEVSPMVARMARGHIFWPEFDIHAEFVVL